MKEVVWGIIGCGDVTELKSGPAFNLVEHSSLLAVMRRDYSKAKDYAKRHLVPEYYDKAELIINHKNINAIYIATPPSTHLEYALKVLAVNKDLYLEKPMTLNTQEAILLREALKKSSSKVTIAHYRRKLPMFLSIKRILNEEKIGEITSVELQMLQSRKSPSIDDFKSNWRINPIISGGGYFNDLAPHQLDLLLYWFGTIKDFFGSSNTQKSNLNVATQVIGELRFKNGVICKGHWDFSYSGTEEMDKCTITGTKGFLSFPLFGNEVVLGIEGQIETLRFEHPKHIQEPMIQATVDYFLGNGKNPCSVEDGLKGMQIIDAFIK